MDQLHVAAAVRGGLRAAVEPARGEHEQLHIVLDGHAGGQQIACAFPFQVG